MEEIIFSTVSAFFIVVGFAICWGIYHRLTQRTKWFKCSVWKFLGTTLSGLVLGLVVGVAAVPIYCSLIDGGAECGILILFSVPLGLALGQLFAFSVVVFIAFPVPKRQPEIQK
ncbi:MAG: hypothetical protein ABIK92_04085 [Pseudomonadota bacterium]